MGGSHESCRRLSKVSEGQNVPEGDTVPNRELLVKYQDVFSRNDKDLGRTSLYLGWLRR